MGTIKRCRSAIGVCERARITILTSSQSTEESTRCRCFGSGKSLHSFIISNIFTIYSYFTISVIPYIIFFFNFIISFIFTFLCIVKTVYIRIMFRVFFLTTLLPRNVPRNITGIIVRNVCGNVLESVISNVLKNVFRTFPPLRFLFLFRLFRIVLFLLRTFLQNNLRNVLKFQ